MPDSRKDVNKGLASRSGRLERKTLKRFLSAVATVAAMAAFSSARAEPTDPIADLIARVGSTVRPLFNTFGLRATLYHLGGHMGHRDSLGCEVVPMRTAAVDGVEVRRHTVLFIKETVGLPMPDGRAHDGYWYASDIGGAIHRGRIDLFTGSGATSMKPLMHLNLATLTVSKVGEFIGCPAQQTVASIDQSPTPPAQAVADTTAPKVDESGTLVSLSAP